MPVLRWNRKVNKRFVQGPRYDGHLNSKGRFVVRAGDFVVGSTHPQPDGTTWRVVEVNTKDNSVKIVVEPPTETSVKQDGVF